jgi:hypothetical protein
MTRKKILIFLGALGLLATLTLLFFSHVFIKPLLEVAIRQNGFPDAHIGSVVVTPNGLLVQDISLDKNSFSIIEFTQIDASLADLLLRKTIKNIELKNVEITGEIDAQGQYIIAGWNASLASQSENESGDTGILIESIAMNGLKLDFETPEGAIRIEGKLALQSTEDKTRNFQANLWGKQKQLSMNATATGKITPEGQWMTEIELLEGRIDMENVKATRAAGKINLRSAAGGIAYQGKMAAGGVRIKDIPFQDFEIAFDAAQKQILNFKTSPTGHDGIVISGHIINQTPLTLELTADIQDTNDLITLFDLKKADLAWLAKTGPLQLSLNSPLAALTAPQMSFTWAIGAGTPQHNFSGTAIVDREAQSLTGVLTTTTLDGPTLTRILPLKENLDVTLSDGSLTLEGTFSVKFAQTPLTVPGRLSVKAKNIGGVWQDYPFNGVSGDAVLTQLSPWALAKDQSITIKTIGTGVNLTNGQLIFDGSQTTGMTFKKASFDMAEGKLSAAPFKWNFVASDNMVTLEMKDVSLKSLVSTVSANGLSADGIIEGTLPIQFKKGSMLFKNASITSKNGGSFSYTPSVFPAALQGEDSRMVTVREALSDFRYTNIEITADGALEGDLKTTFKASGKNPVFSDRMINLNINLEGALVPALQQALQPGRIADRIEKSVTGDQQ